MRENVAENINYIDEVMKKRVEAYKDVQNDKITCALPETNSHKTLGSQKSLASMAPQLTHLLDRPSDRRKELMEKYSHLLKKGSVNQDILDPFHSSGQEDNYEVIFEEMERLKESETEARNEVLTL